MARLRECTRLKVDVANAKLELGTDGLILLVHAASA